MQPIAIIQTKLCPPVIKDSVIRKAKLFQKFNKIFSIVPLCLPPADSLATALVKISINDLVGIFESPKNWVGFSLFSLSDGPPMCTLV